MTAHFEFVLTQIVCKLTVNYDPYHSPIAFAIFTVGLQGNDLTHSTNKCTYHFVDRTKSVLFGQFDLTHRLIRYRPERPAVAFPDHVSTIHYPCGDVAIFAAEIFERKSTRNLLGNHSAALAGCGRVQTGPVGIDLRIRNNGKRNFSKSCQSRYLERMRAEWKPISPPTGT